MGILKNIESGMVSIRSKKISNFTPIDAESNEIKLSIAKKTIIKGYEFEMKTPQQVCPNLAVSFISFNETLKSDNLQPTTSFLQIKEYDANRIKEKGDNGDGGESANSSVES